MPAREPSDRNLGRWNRKATRDGLPIPSWVLEALNMEIVMKITDKEGSLP